MKWTSRAFDSIEEGREQSDDEGELVPEFEATSPPFIEFRFYYKSRGA